MKRLLVVFALAASAGAADRFVFESERRIPVAYQVDVVVIGGSTGGVAAAVQAAEAGKKVFLLAPRPYLGEDVCAPMRLWLEAGVQPRSAFARKVFGDGTGPYRPLQIKKALDDQLLSHQIPFLYSAYATDLLRDARGKPAGIVMANRAGRQAVRARIIIDATPRGVIARLAGVRFPPPDNGPRKLHRIVIGPEPRAGDSAAHARPTGLFFPADDKPQQLVEYDFTLPVDGSSYGGWMAAEHQARDWTETSGVMALTEEIFEPAFGKVQVRRAAGVYALGGDGRLPSPLAFIDAGISAGSMAAAEASAIASPANAELQVIAPGTAYSAGDTHESLAGLRSTAPEPGTEFVRSPERALPVLGEYDVVVVGGGTGGAPAGIGAARNGARTLVIEYLAGLGGQGTLGRINSYYWGNRTGITQEALVLGSRWDPTEKAEWWRRELRKAGADVWFGTLGCGVFSAGNRVKGVVVATPAGRGVVLAKTVIDSTGNADVAGPAGARFLSDDRDEVAQQGAGVPAIRLGAGGSNTDFTIVDESDMMDLWHVFVYAKDKYLSAFDAGQIIASRERKRVRGDIVLNILDQVNNRTYPDTITIAYTNFDTHGFTVDPYFLFEHPDKEGIPVNLPFRCLLPEGVENLLVIGLGISVQRDSLPLTRMQADIQNLGFASGVAAAMGDGRSLRSIDVRALQKKLIAAGVLPQEVLSQSDSYPLSEEQVARAVESIRHDYQGISVLLARPDVALSKLRAAFAASGLTRADRLTYARILAVLGDNAGVPLLIEELDSRPWDPGWSYDWSAIGTQFGAAMSQVDTLIVALGRSRDVRALNAILSKTDQLDGKSAFSHFRAVSLALESLESSQGAPHLASLLQKPGVGGYANTTLELARERNGKSLSESRDRARAIREISLARALYRCGDYEGLAHAVLTRYTQDLRGHLSRHALAILAEKSK